MRSVLHYKHGHGHTGHTAFKTLCNAIIALPIVLEILCLDLK